MMKLLPNISIGFLDKAGVGSALGPVPPRLLFFDVGYVAPDAQIIIFEVYA